MIQRRVFRTLTIVTVATLLVLLMMAVWNGYLSPSCESIYNRFSATNDTTKQADIFEQGIEKGCWKDN